METWKVDKPGMRLAAIRAMHVDPQRRVGAAMQRVTHIDEADAVGLGVSASAPRGRARRLSVRASSSARAPSGIPERSQPWRPARGETRNGGGMTRGAADPDPSPAVDPPRNSLASGAGDGPAPG